MHQCTEVLGGALSKVTAVDQFDAGQAMWKTGFASEWDSVLGLLQTDIVEDGWYTISEEETRRRPDMVVGPFYTTPTHKQADTNCDASKRFKNTT